MKKIFCALILTAFSAVAAEIPVKNGTVTAMLNTRGASVSELKFKGKSLVQAKLSFTDRLLANKSENGVKKEISELFENLEYRVDKLEADYTKTIVQFSVRGIGAFDWLRLIKTYRFAKNNPEFLIDYKLENLDSQEHHAGLWTKTFLRRGESGLELINNIYQPHEKGIKTLAHPGAGIASDEWSLAPMYAWLAACGRDDKTGAMVILPQKLVSAFYSWFDLAKSISTLEWFIRDQKIPAKGAIAFTVKVKVSEKIPELVNFMKYYRTAAPEGEALWLPLLYAGREKNIELVQNAAGNLRKSEKYMDVSVARQYCASIRAVRLPASADPEKVSVFEIANGQADDTRPVPFHLKKLNSGEYQVMFKVPGLNPHGYHETRFEKDGSAFDLNGKYAGQADYPVRVMLDRAPERRYDAADFAGGPDIIYNGSFTKKAPYGDWPDGYYWSWCIRGRKWYRYEDGSITLTRPSNKDWTQFPVHFRVEGGRKYSVSLKIRNDNRTNRVFASGITFLDADGKEIKGSGGRIGEKSEPHDWTEYQQTYFAPANAVTGKFNILVFGVKDQNVSIKDLKIVPEDTPYIQKNKIDLMREQLKCSWYKPLDNLESISHDYVTPHEKWMKPSSFTPAEILYLPYLKGELESPKRRLIVELAQRMDLKYKYIPLLAKITHLGRGALGVISPTCAPELEPYTLECLRQIKKAPKVILVQGLNFDKDVQKEFTEILADFQRRGASLLFVNCAGIPQDFLGPRVPRSESVMLLPQMRKLSANALDEFLSHYQQNSRRSAVFKFSNDNYYFAARLLPSTMEEQKNEVSPSYAGKDFPYWEYMYLPLMKTIRWLADVAPEAEFQAFRQENDMLAFRIAAKQAGCAKLTVRFKDLHRQTNATVNETIQLNAGQNRIALKVPAIPGGVHIAEYHLAKSDGRISDAGASRIETPQTAPLSIDFINQDRIYPFDKPVNFTIHAQNVPAGSLLKTIIEDTSGREVFSQTAKAEEINSFSVRLKHPYTTLYRIISSLEKNGGILSSQFGEFSLSGRKFDTKDLTAVIWLLRPELHQRVRELGYDMLILWHSHDNHKRGTFRNLRNLDLAPVIVGSGYELNDMGLNYRHDKVSDPVRKPCYSDGKRQEAVRDVLRKRAVDDHYNYYNVRHNFLGDELYLGSTVCYSPDCLKGFRESLKKQYENLGALNKEWNTAFKNWDEVVPCQLNELKDKNNLSRWLDHKMFMAGVFAHQYAGKTREYLNEAVPGTRFGLSGTQLPGYSYDWAQLMKHINFIAYYGGVQAKLVHDFGGADLISGQWGCGYVDTSVPHDQYQHASLWRNLFNGANLAANYGAGSTINGDMSLNSNIRVYSEVMREMKRGIAKLVLTSKPAGENVAVLYSQPSLFAAMGSIGINEWQNAYSGWNALLEDLNINFRFISYEDLAEGLEGTRCKVLILPASVALSPAQAKSMEQFVRSGGTVIADFAPGYFNGHGRKGNNAELAALFGISATDTALSLSGREIKLEENSKEGIPAIRGSFRIGSVSLPVMHVNHVGKGRAILMNLLVNGYQTTTLGGVGGELSSQTSGAEIFCRNLRHLVGGLLKSSGVHERCTVTAADELPYPCQTMLRSSGDNYVFGIMKFTQEGNTFDMSKGTEVNVKLPVKGHLYNVREKKYLAYGDSFRMKLVPAWGYLYTVLQNRIERVEVTAPLKLKRGTMLKTGFRAVAEKGSAGPQVFHVEFLRPDGTADKVYSKNIATEDGSGEYALQTAYNDVPGKWILRVTNVNTGLTGEKSIEFQ